MLPLSVVQLNISMNNQKSFVPAVLVLLGVVAVGFLFYASLGSSPAQIAKVTPISSPFEAAMPFLSPVVVSATPEPAPQPVAPAADLASAFGLTGPITSSLVSGAGNSVAVFTDVEVSVNQSAGTVGEQPAALGNIPQPHGIPTPIPADDELERGEALAQVLGIDQVWEVEAENPLTFDREPVPLDLTEFFNNDFDPWTGTPPTLTDKLLSLDGKMVELKGYMAPPLKLGLDWFLLTDFPVGVCPYHSNASSITAGMALIYVEGPEFPYTYEPLRMVGELHVGELADPETGMVSIARLYTQKEEINMLSLNP